MPPSAPPTTHVPGRHRPQARRIVIECSGCKFSSRLSTIGLSVALAAFVMAVGNMAIMWFFLAGL